jgi:hypothetical protein
VNRLLVLAAGFAAGAGTVLVGEVVAQVANEGTATLECEGSFTEGGQLDCTIHDLVTLPATTAPPTTPPTTAAPTTTSTTTPPPGRVVFFEDFTGDTIDDFTATFDWSVVDLWRRNEPWPGHHNEMCEGPTTERELHHIVPASNTDPGEEFWLCGPGGADTDHLMTSNGQNGTFGITAFAPKQAFTSPRVCWDVNLTVSHGRRLWWEVQLINSAAVANEKLLAQGGGIGEGMVGGVDFERGTARLAWGRGPDGTFMKRPWPADSLVFDFTEELVTIWKGQQSMHHAEWVDRVVTDDRATRAHHCMVDNRNGTVTISQQRITGWPEAPAYVRTVPGSFPSSYRLILSAHNYNAGKDGTQPFQTWHWDNILVATA